ncbi:M48 family metalloprotease [Streptomyces huiliensis]|uniref:M48 family metalloprotease n=1 Tax=Streptomyces huiliensis TaxID=2876027 RepID=UPI001CBAF2F0|nr:M48 family metallopeptidase [Streptomyces huiliensis]MBZ4319187.1 M48 family metalloprotease [Streptomyces huiliensis]
MGVSLRAFRALVLLFGFYLFCVAVLCALVGTGVFVYWSLGAHAATLKLITLPLLLAVPLVRGMLHLRTPQDDGEDGLPVTEAEQPRLWAAVREVAAAAGTRAPDEIFLVGDVNAAVSENSRFLGLIPGRRRLYVGVPLMTGLMDSQLRAVLGHEFGHYCNADTRISAITLRGRHALARTVTSFRRESRKQVEKELTKQRAAAEKRIRKGRRPKKTDASGAGLSYRLMARLFVGYAKFYLRTTRGDGRRQELAADRVAVRVAGRDAAASALRRTAALADLHDFYLHGYATLGLPAGLLPPEGQFYGGLGHLLAAPGRYAEFERLARELPDTEPSPYDAHPPMAERVARIEALPDDGRGADGPARWALELLDAPDRVLARLEEATLTPEVLRLRRASWPELVHFGIRAHRAAEVERLRAATAAYTGGDGSLRALLDAADGGLLWHVAARLAGEDGDDAEADPRAELLHGLHALLILELVDAGWAGWELSWSDAARLRLPEGYDELVPAAVAAVAAEVPDTRPLRSLLPAA